MDGTARTARSARRSRHGLVIEGTVANRSTPAPVAPTGDAALAGLDLAARAAGRPYQSLLDDAIRLAGRCRTMGSAGWRMVSSSS